METYIKKFDEKIKELIELNPNDDCLKVIIEFKDKKKYDSFYMTLDDIGSIVGLEFIIIEKSSKNNRYVPNIKFSHENPLKQENGIYPLTDVDVPFDSKSKVYKYMAKEYIYLLKRIPNLRELVLPH
ncbi:MAG: hypothetical protein P1U44_10770 [Vicingaceae bacterium]|nr:hypothetical protein [Vicingaceae bacterium]